VVEARSAIARGLRRRLASVGFQLEQAPDRQRVGPDRVPWLHDELVVAAVRTIFAGRA
jgi:hypothetical protein